MHKQSVNHISLKKILTLTDVHACVYSNFCQELLGNLISSTDYLNWNLASLIQAGYTTCLSLKFSMHKYCYLVLLMHPIICEGLTAVLVGSTHKPIAAAECLVYHFEIPPIDCWEIPLLGNPLGFLQEVAMPQYSNLAENCKHAWDKWELKPSVIHIPHLLTNQKLFSRIVILNHSELASFRCKLWNLGSLKSNAA